MLKKFFGGRGTAAKFKTATTPITLKKFFGGRGTAAKFTTANDATILISGGIFPRRAITHA